MIALSSLEAKIILGLYRGEKTNRELRQRIGCSQTSLYLAKRELKSYDLLETETRRVFSHDKMGREHISIQASLRLTSKGLRIALHLSEISTSLEPMKIEVLEK